MAKYFSIALLIDFTPLSQQKISYRPTDDEVCHRKLLVYFLWNFNENQKELITIVDNFNILQPWEPGILKIT